jgi:ribosome-associated toxin RatA of RatAB toxin-antitoxin module
MAETRQSFSAEIDATPEQCFRAITDFPAYPEWSSVISKTTVLDAYPDGLPRRIEFELDMKIRTVRYVLDYTYQRPHRLDWKLVEGDVEDVAGTYTFERVGKKTRTTCEQAVSLGFWIPGPIRRIAEQKALKDSVLEFKAEVEKRKKKSSRSPSP